MLQAPTSPAPIGRAQRGINLPSRSRRLMSVCAFSSPPGQPHSPPATHIVAERQGANNASAAAGARPLLVLSSTTAANSATDAPTIFARFVVTCAVALSTVWAILGSSSTAATALAPRTAPASQAASDDGPSAFLESPTPAIAPPPTQYAIPTLRSPEQFDAFVVAANAAGYLVVVLFHAPWCSASRRMEAELGRLSQLFLGRRMVFARVDCSLTRSGQRCNLTQLHRVTKTPTLRMYWQNACVDEVGRWGCGGLVRRSGGPSIRAGASALQHTAVSVPCEHATLAWGRHSLVVVLFRERSFTGNLPA